MAGQGQGGPRALLWVGDPEVSAPRDLIESVCRELEIEAVFIHPENLAPALARRRFDLVGVEIGDAAALALGLLRDLHHRAPHLTLFAISADASLDLTRAAIEAGASDVVSLPLHGVELQRALLKLTRLSARAALPARAVDGDIVTIYGARGGLGATTLAVNLAVSLAALIAPQPVALADLDLQRGDVAAFLNLTPQQSLASFVGVAGADEIFLHHTLTRHASGVAVLPAPTQVLEADAIGADEVATGLRLLRTQFVQTVVDTARALTEPTLPAFELADRILLLSDLSVPGVRAARRVVDVWQRLGIRGERIELVVTEAVAGPVPLEDAAAAIGKTPLLVLPRDDAAAGKAMNAGAPLNGVRPVGLRAAIGELAARLAGRPVERDRRGMLGRLFGRGARERT